MIYTYLLDAFTDNNYKTHKNISKTYDGKIVKYEVISKSEKKSGKEIKFVELVHTLRSERKNFEKSPEVQKKLNSILTYMVSQKTEHSKLCCVIACICNLFSKLQNLLNGYGFNTSIQLAEDFISELDKVPTPSTIPLVNTPVVPDETPTPKDDKSTKPSVEAPNSQNGHAPQTNVDVSQPKKSETPTPNVDVSQPQNGAASVPQVDASKPKETEAPIPNVNVSQPQNGAASVPQVDSQPKKSETPTPNVNVSQPQNGAASVSQVDASKPKETEAPIPNVNAQPQEDATPAPKVDSQSKKSEVPAPNVNASQPQEDAVSKPKPEEDVATKPKETVPASDPKEDSNDPPVLPVKSDDDHAISDEPIKVAVEEDIGPIDNPHQTIMEELEKKNCNNRFIKKVINKMTVEQINEMVTIEDDNDESIERTTLLHKAAENVNGEIYGYLLEKGAHDFIRNERGNVKYLLSKKKDVKQFVSIPSEKGNVPLFFFVENMKNFAEIKPFMTKSVFATNGDEKESVAQLIIDHGHAKMADIIIALRKCKYKYKYPEGHNFFEGLNLEGCTISKKDLEDLYKLEREH